MKKSLLALAVAAASVALIAPKFIGDDANAQLDGIISSVNDLPGYKLTVENREQGWFSSATTLKFGFDPISLDPSLADTPEVLEMMETLQFEFDVDMQHGPVLMSKGLGLSGIQVRIPNNSDDVTFSGEKVENIYVLDGKLNLFGGLSYEDSFSPLQFDFADGQGKVDFTGYNGTATPENDGINYVSTGGTLDINVADMNFNLSNISAVYKGDFNYAQSLKGTYGNMDTSVVFGNFAATQAGNPLFAWKNLEMFFVNKLDENNVADMQGGYRIANLDTPIEKFENVEIAFEILNLSQKVMEKYYELMPRLQDPELDQQALLTELQPFAIEVLAHQPAIKVTNIGFTTPTGTLKSQADIKLASYEFDEAKLVDEAFWQNNLLLDSSVSLPKAMALDLAQKSLMMQFQADPSSAQYTPEQLKEAATQQAQMMLDNFMQGGFLTEENGELSLIFNVKDAMANLNGQEIPLAALLPAEAE